MCWRDGCRADLSACAAAAAAVFQLRVHPGAAVLAAGGGHHSHPVHHGRPLVSAAQHARSGESGGGGDGTGWDGLGSGRDATANDGLQQLALV